MGILEKLLDFIFGKPVPNTNKNIQKNATKGKEIDLEGAREIVAQETLKEENALLEPSSKKFAEIKYLLNLLSKNSALLEQQKINLDEGNKRFRQIVNTSQKALARQLKSLSQKLIPPQNITIEGLRIYSESSLRSVSADILPYWKNIVLAKVILKEEIKTVGANLQELSTILEELRAKAYSQKIENLRELKALVKKLSENESKKYELKNKISVLEQSIAINESEIAGLTQKISVLQASEEYATLFKLTKEKENLAKQREQTVSSINSEIASVEKILKRLSSLSENSDMLTKKEKEILQMLLQGPFAAVIADPNGTISKRVLLKAKELISKGDITLKDSEKEKRLQVLMKLLEKDFFTDYFWKANNIQAQQLGVEKSISLLQVTTELFAMQRELDSKKKTSSENSKQLEQILKEHYRLENSTELRQMKTMFDSEFYGIYELKI